MKNNVKNDKKLKIVIHRLGGKGLKTNLIGGVSGGHKFPDGY